jgi:hypothetical protein
MNQQRRKRRAAFTVSKDGRRAPARSAFVSSLFIWLDDSLAIEL